MNPVNKSGSQNWGHVFALLLGIIFLVPSCAPKISPEMERLWASQFVSEDAFLAINNGATFNEVKEAIGNAIRHQFTVVDDGHTWKLIRCFLHTGEDESFSFYQLLFRDDILIKTIGWIRMEREEYPYRGSIATRAKPWEIEDSKYVKKAVDSPSLTHAQIEAELKKDRHTMEKYKGQGNMPAPVFSLFALFSSAGIEKEYSLNDELRKRFDGCRVSMGMTEEEVDALYGQPVHTVSTARGNTVRIYGDNRTPDINPFIQFSFVGVLFNQNGQVNSVYSDLFFCNDWLPNGGRRTGG